MSIHDAKQSERWLGQLRSASPDDCIAALQEISRQDSVTGLALYVVPLAGSSNDEIRVCAAEALEFAIQPSTSEQLFLIQLLESSNDGEICYWAATMLGRLGKDAGTSAHALEACVRQSMYLPARERAAWALSKIGASAVVALPTLREAAETAPIRLRHLALEAIKQIEKLGPGNSRPSETSEESANTEPVSNLFHAAGGPDGLFPGNQEAVQ